MKYAAKKGVNVMDEVGKMMLDDDIMECNEIWNKYSHDSKRMGGLFDMLIMRYSDIIEDFSEGMEVVTSYENPVQQGELYRKNVKLLLTRMENFRKNGYSNDGLKELYIKSGIKGGALDISFNEARKIIQENGILSILEKKEISDKLDEMEEIYNVPDTKRNKWEKMRPYVIWSTGKDADTAMLILSMVLKIN
jgi:hypothetical protein